MATIHRFPTKQRNNDEDLSFSQKIRYHKLKNLGVALACACLFILIIIILVSYYKNQVYTKIQVINSVDRINIETNSYLNNEGSLIVYSKDGVSCIDSKGGSVWNMTYEMQGPIVKRSKNYVGVADYNGHEIHMINNAGKIVDIDTKLPVRDIAVSDEGLIAAIIEDSSNSWVYLYNFEGQQLVEIKATMTKTGYPVSLAISGEVMAVSYFYVDSESMRSSVTFYNFGGVGENVADRIVSSYEYVDAVVPIVDFLNSSSVFAVADNRLMFFTGDKKPVSTADILFSENLVGVYNGGNKVGLVFYDTEGENKYRLDIYDASGKKNCSYKYDMDFKDILLSNGQALIYNNSQCIIIDSDGKEKFTGTFDEPVNFIVTTDKANKYLFVKDATLDTVRIE